MINDWTPETKSLIESLKAAGFTILSGDNGEERFAYKPGKEADFIENLTATDDAVLWVKHSSRERKDWLSLIYGNSPGELASDYSSCPELDTVTEAHYDKWEKRQQPKKEDRRR